MSVTIPLDKQDNGLIQLLIDSRDGTQYGYYTIQTNLETHSAFEATTNNQSAAIDLIVQGIIDSYDPRIEMKKLRRQDAKRECLRRVKKELPDLKRLLLLGKGPNDTEEEEGDAQTLAQSVFGMFTSAKSGFNVQSMSNKWAKAFEIDEFTESTVLPYINDNSRTFEELRDLNVRTFFSWPDNT